MTRDRSERVERLRASCPGTVRGTENANGGEEQKQRARGSGSLPRNVLPVWNWQGGARVQRRAAHSPASGYGHASAGCKPAARRGAFRGTNREPGRLGEFSPLHGVRGENVVARDSAVKTVGVTTPHPQSLSPLRGEGSRKAVPPFPSPGDATAIDKDRLQIKCSVR